jgi:signal transduction histidine kinase/DNA-binding NarL/FixJ family response regulator
MLDTKTLLIAITLINLYMTVTLFAYGRSQKTYPGFSLWLTGTVMVAATYILLFLRGIAPDWLTIPVANTIVMISAVFRIEGIKRFIGRVGKFNYWNLWLSTLTFLWYWYFTFGQNSLPIRNAMFAAATIFIIVWLSRLLLASPWNKPRGITYFFVGILSFYSLFLLIRAIGLFLQPADQGLLANTVVNSMYFLVALIGDISWTVCFMLLNGQRTTIEVQTLSERVLQTAAEYQRSEAELHQKRLQMIALDERERLSRDLHDGLGQVLGYINVETQAIETLLQHGENQAAQANLQQVTRAARQAHDEVRQHILGLRQEHLPAVRMQGGFWATLQAYLEQVQARYAFQAGLWRPDDLPDSLFPPGVEQQVLRIIQEALTNAGKHAHASRVDVEFHLTQDQVTITIADNGVGFSPPGQTPATAQNGQGHHFGLQIMDERAESVGGKVAIFSQAENGTRVTITLPRFWPASAEGEEVQGLRVLLADDHPLFLDGLCNLLLARGITVVGVAHDGNQAIEKVRLLHPDVAVLDLNMPGCNGIAATQRIKAEYPEIKVVILTVAEDEEHLFEAIQNGASGYLLKSLEANQFVHLLIGLLRGEAALSAGMSERLLAEFARRSGAPHSPQASQYPEMLTPRQWEILQRVAQGMTYKEVGVALGISEKAVKYHMAQIIERLNVENRAQAVAYALQAGRGKGV